MSQELPRLVGFATLGVLTTTQEIAGRVLEAITEADPQTVVEETFAVVAVASARAAEVGFESQPDVARAAGATLASLPLFHQDYMVGSAVLANPSSPVEADADSITRRISFYASHLQEGVFPGSAVLNEKLELFMGRVSVPGLETSPSERVASLELVDSLSLHLRVILGFARSRSSIAETTKIGG